MTDRTAHEADFHARARASRDAIEARDEDVSRTWQRGTDADVLVGVVTADLVAVTAALSAHRVNEVHAMCLCGWESPHGRERRTHHCLQHQAEQVLAALEAKP